MRAKTAVSIRGLIVAACCLAGSGASAANATWNVDSNAIWGVNGNWNPAAGFPNGVGQIAAVTNNITANRTIYVNGGTTIGTLFIGDNDNTSDFTITTTNNSTLTMDVSSGSAQIIQLYRTAAGNTSAVPIRVNDPLYISNSVSGMLRFTGVFSGSQPITFAGGLAQGQGNIALNANNLYYSGGFTILTNARVAAQSVNSLPGAMTTVQGGGQIYLAGGMFRNNFTLSGRGWNEASHQYLGAMRLSNGTFVDGAVTLAGDSRVSTYNTGTGSANIGVLLGAVSGPGNLEIDEQGSGNAGTVVLAADNSYGGTTIGAQGILVLGVGGRTGTVGTGGVTNNGILVYNRVDAYTLPALVSGAGSQVVVNNGRLALSAGSGLNNLQLSSNAAIDIAAMPAGLAVNQWSGHGTVAGAPVLTTAGVSVVQPGGNGAANAPGAYGVLTAAAGLTLGAGVTNRFDLGAAPGRADRVDVGGNLALGGDVVINAMGALAPTQTLFRYEGALSGAIGSIAVPNTRYTATLNTAKPGEVRAILSGAPAALTWSGTVDGNWDLNATANWNGGASTFLNADHVRFDDTGLNPSLNLTGMLVPGSVTVDASQAYTFGGTGKISGDAGIVKDGAGTLRINTANDFLGDVIVSNGVIQGGSATAFGASGPADGKTHILPGATLDLVGVHQANETIVLSGAGVGGTGAVVNTAAGFNNGLRHVMLADDTTLGGANRFDVRGAYNGDAWMDGGAYTLTKTGANTMPFVNAAVQVGEIVIDQGMLGFEAASTLNDDGFGIAVNPGASLGLYQQQYPISREITLNGGTLNGYGSSGTQQNRLTGPVNLAAGTTGTVLGSHAVLLDGEVRGPGHLFKTSTNALWLTASNTFNGNVTLNNGTLVIANSMALGASTSVTINSGTAGGAGFTGSRLELRGNVTAGAGVTLTFNAVSNATRLNLLTPDSSTNTWAGSIVPTLNGPQQIGADQGAGGLVVSGPVTNDAFTGTVSIRGGGLTAFTGDVRLPLGYMSKNDGGSVLFTSTNNQMVTFQHLQGNLLFGGDNVLGAATITLTGAADKNNPTVASDSGAARRMDNYLNITTNVIFGIAAVRNGDLTFGGNVELNGGTRTFTINNTNTTFLGAINNGNITKAGNGRMVLKGASGGLGDVTVTAGHLALGDDNALGFGTLNMNSANAGLSSADASARSIPNNLTISSSIVFGRDGAGDLTFNGTINNGALLKTLTVSNALVTMNGPMIGTGTMIKSGPGTLVFGGSVASDNVTVNEGVLQVGPFGSFGSGSLVLTVNDGATLDVTPWFSPTINGGQILAGSGAVTGSLTTSFFSYLRPGAAAVPGTLTMRNDLSLGFLSTAQFDFGPAPAPGGVNDLVTVAGNLDMQGVIEVTPIGPLVTGVAYRAFTYGGTFTGSEPGVTVPFSRYTATANTNTAGQLNIVFDGAPLNLVWSGGTADWDLSTTANWNGGADVFMHADRVRFDDTGATTGVTITATVIPGSVTVDSTKNYSFTGPGKISGLSGIAKSGSGILTVSTTNDFLGDVIVSNGTLRTGAPWALGATNGATIVRNGATLDWNAVNVQSGERVYVEGAGVGGMGAVYSQGGADVNAAVNMTLTGDTTFGGSRRWDFNGNNLPASFDGSAYTLTKISNIIVAFKYVPGIQVGDIRVQQGDIRLEDTSTINGDYDIHVAPNATYSQWRLRQPMDRDIWFTNATFLVGAANNATENVMRGTFNLTGNVTNNITGFSTLAGKVSGSGQLVKTGGGTLILLGTNDYAGGTLVSAGTLQLGTNGATGWFGAGAATVVNNGTLTINRSDDVTLDRPVAGNGTFIKTGNGTLTVTGSVSSINSGSGIFRVLGGALTNAGGSIHLNGEMWVADGAGSVARYVQTGGELIVSNWIAVGRNAFSATGTFDLAGGVVHKRGLNNVIVGSVGGSGTLNINGGAFYNNSLIALAENGGGGNLSVGSGTLNLNGGLAQATQVVEYNNNSGVSVVNFDGGTLQAVQNQNQFIRVDHAYVKPGGATIDTAGFNVTLGQPLEDDGQAGGGLTKTGAGVLTLNALCDYDGDTVVSNGTLRLVADNLLPRTAAIRVEQGATLDASAAGFTVRSGVTFSGSGAVLGGLALADGSKLAPGSSPGTLAVNGDLNTALESEIEFELASAADYDRILAINNLSLGGSVRVVLLGGYDPLSGTVFNLFDWSGTFTGGDYMLDLPQLQNGKYWVTDDFETMGEISVIPEPATAGLLGLALAAAWLGRRRGR